MRAYDTIYHEWALLPSLTAFELDRVLQHALRAQQVPTVERLLSHHTCTPEQLNQVRQSPHPAIVRLWARSRQCTPESLARHVEEAPLEELTAAFVETPDAHVPHEVLDLMWARGERELRIHVLAQLHWSHDTDPRWGVWLREHLEGGDLSDAEIAWLAKSSAEHTFEAVSESSHPLALQVVAEICAQAQDLSLHPWHRSAMVEKLTALVESGAGGGSLPSISHLGVLRASQVIVASVAGGHERFADKPLAGSAEGALLSRALELLPAGETRTRLESLIPDPVERAPSAPRGADLLEALSRGLTPDLVQAASEVEDLDEDFEADALWSAVAAHPRLRADQVPALLRRGSTPQRVAQLLAGRRPTWRRRAAVAAWGHSPRSVMFREIVTGLTATDQRLVACTLAGAEPEAVDVLGPLGLVSADVLSVLPTRHVSSIWQRHSRELLELHRSVLGEETAAWQVVEALIDEHTGTYGDLLAAARDAVAEK